MLIEFSVANFKSIRDEVRLSLVAGPREGTSRNPRRDALRARYDILIPRSAMRPA